MLKLLEKTPSLSLSMKLSNTLRVIDSITFLVSITKIIKAYLLAEKKLFSHINQTEKVQDWLQMSINSARWCYIFDWRFQWKEKNKSLKLFCWVSLNNSNVVFFIKVKRHQSFKDGKCRGFYPCPFGRGTPYKRFIDKKEQQECSELCAKNINGNIKWRIRICSDDIQMHLSTNVQCCAEVLILSWWYFNYS